MNGHGFIHLVYFIEKWRELGIAHHLEGKYQVNHHGNTDQQGEDRHYQAGDSEAAPGFSPFGEDDQQDSNDTQKELEWWKAAGKKGKNANEHGSQSHVIGLFVGGLLGWYLIVVLVWTTLIVWRVAVIAAASIGLIAGIGVIAVVTIVIAVTIAAVVRRMIAGVIVVMIGIGLVICAWGIVVVIIVVIHVIILRAYWL